MNQHNVKKRLVSKRIRLGLTVFFSFVLVFYNVVVLYKTSFNDQRTNNVYIIIFLEVKKIGGKM